MDGFSVVVVCIQLLAAAGIIGFWLTAGRASFDEPWRPPGFAQHERSFTLPDTVTAVVLAASAGLVVAGSSYGRSLALVGAGMLAFLGIIDFSYMRRNGLFAREHDGLMHASIVVAVLAVAALLLVRYL